LECINEGQQAFFFSSQLLLINGSANDWLKFIYEKVIVFKTVLQRFPPNCGITGLGDVCKKNDDC